MNPVTHQRLHALLHPRSVALVGATDRSGFSWITYRNLIESGLEDSVYLVNRRGSRAHGRAALTSCTQIGRPADLAFMMVPRAATQAALTDVAAAGIRSVAVLTSGYADAGETGRKAQQELRAQADSLGVLLLGPNHLGFASIVSRTAVTAIPGLPREPGPVALVSQSGMAASAMVDFAAMSGTGLSYVVTVGNEAMITAGHLLGYLAADEHTRAIALFMETVREPAVFAAGARAAARAGKAVVVLKAGGSAMSARVAAAHTGAGDSDEAGTDALFRDLGVIRVHSIEDMVLTAGAAAHLGRLARPGIGVVSISGGACSMLADHAAHAGVDLPAFAPATREALTRLLPGYATVQNPLDITGAAINDPALFTAAVELVAADPSVGVVAVINSLPWQRDDRPWVGQVLADAIGAGTAAAAVPVVHVTQAMQPVSGYTQQVMARAKIPYTISGLREAVVALASVARWSAGPGNGGQDA